MLDLKKIFEISRERHRNHLDRAKKNPKAKQSKIDQRRNQPIHERLCYAAMGVSDQIELSNDAFALVCAAPEILMPAIRDMAFGPYRKQNKKKPSDSEPPEVLKKYHRDFSNQGNDKEKEKYSLENGQKLLNDIKSKKIKKSLLCHGLSPSSDTILLFAEIGRVARINYALGLEKIEVMLADASWIRHNRSIAKLFSSPKSFENELRLCQDKRIRLYKAIGLDAEVFSVPNARKKKNIKEGVVLRAVLVEKAKSYRALASTIWGDKVLLNSDTKTKAHVGRHLNSAKNRPENFPCHMKTLLSFEKSASALETSLKGELTIIRTLFDLFSTLEVDVFVYYFAQFAAQEKYDNYLKTAPISETKFDKPFRLNREVFASAINPNHTKKKKKKSYHNIYLPQYSLGKHEILPYTSVSGDIAKNNIKRENMNEQVIWIDDVSEKERVKIRRIIRETEVSQRNRLVSDLMSFCHVCVSQTEADQTATAKLQEAIKSLDENISNQIFEDQLEDYNRVFSDWIKSIATAESFVPFHILPYLWDETEWNDDRLDGCANFIVALNLYVQSISDF